MVRYVLFSFFSCVGDLATCVVFCISIHVDFLVPIFFYIVLFVCVLSGGALVLLCMGMSGAGIVSLLFLGLFGLGVVFLVI